MVSLVNSSMPAKIPRVAVYMPPEIKQRLEAVAEKDRRSLSQMICILLEEALDRREAEAAKEK